MLHRVRQLLRALAAKLTDEDREYVRRHLNPKESRLFYQMDMVTQKHALNVAYTAEKTAREFSGYKLNLLVKGALLHDIGKQAGDVSAWDRVLFVVVDTLSPPLGKRIAREGRGSLLANLRHGFYVHYEHPVKGGLLAKEAALDYPLIELIRNHHKPPCQREPVELTIIRRSDSLN